MDRTDHLSFALEYQRRAVAADLAGEVEAASLNRTRAAFHAAKACAPALD